ncbi:MAG: ureidoglycolate lyase [Deltaproteobacteria bacterium]|nr:ureidoglycolate lyase [Deltaproteobacteria bacterium]MCB9787182.1 ureidoglycolate lyase [Deltaproteobacteria bacterium]
MELSNFVGHDLDAMPSTARGEARVHRVPRVPASDASLAGYGRLVQRFDPADVTLVPWPVSGRRPLVPGTGAEGGVVQDRFVFERRGGLQFATNHAVGRSYLTGWYGDPATASSEREPARTDALLTHEANYHPDGGQIFSPRDGCPFVALLARPGDDVRPEDFVAFAFDGRAGVHIDPGVWHQPVYPVGGAGTFDDAQGRVHACVSVDLIAEFGLYLEVPLRG